MEIASFDDLLQAARMQPEPQRLLFVFAAAELPDDATPAQRARFEAGQGGALVPLMCVDKTPQELASFSALVEEAQQFTAPGHDWAMVFAAALPGTLNKAPTSADAEAPLQRMVDAIKGGAHGAYIPFNRQGQPVRLG
ncbi:ribonucleotide reductase subunit alpha [Acidovorax sp.]|uniref:ribonucleotide reductase subunit alpha n=1 Tax=Acidovorax sp. TaxID=1872122 RepID=UPI0025C4763D|nr:ribonucleotide reductase subunit alpha [Acidovorax sp.]MBW8464958.1 ribonucleotide reductase subunit alpha [Acidovorax sp.]